MTTGHAVAQYLSHLISAASLLTNDWGNLVAGNIEGSLSVVICVTYTVWIQIWF